MNPIALLLPALIIEYLKSPSPRKGPFSRARSRFRAMEVINAGSNKSSYALRYATANIRLEPSTSPRQPVTRPASFAIMPAYRCVARPSSITADIAIRRRSDYSSDNTLIRSTLKGTSYRNRGVTQLRNSLTTMVLLFTDCDRTLNGYLAPNRSVS